MILVLLFMLYGTIYSHMIIFHVICVTEKWCAKIYQHADPKSYGGWRESVFVGSNSFKHNDQASAVRVNSGCTFTGHEHHGLKGRFETFTEPKFTKFSSLNDKLSSYTCHCNDGKYIIF